MTQKSETPVLILSLVITIGLIGGGLWWLTRNSTLDPTTLLGSGSPTAGNPGSTLGNAQGANTFAQVKGVPSGLFSYGGSTTWAPIRKQVDSQLQAAVPEFRLRYTDPINGSPGSSTGIRMLIDNQLAFAQSSRPLKDEEYQQAQQRGFELQEIPVAIDGIAIAVNPNLQVPGLTVAQLRDIYTGKITNWNQVGGPNLKLTAYSRRLEEGGTIEFFAANVLKKQSFGSTVQFIGTTTEALRKVAADPGGLYYASAPEIIEQCTVKALPLGLESNQLVPPYREPFVPLSQCPAQRNQLNQRAFQDGSYPITRRLFVVVKRSGQTDQEAGQAYANLLLSNQGQDLVEQAGYVRIR